MNETEVREFGKAHLVRRTCHGTPDEHPPFGPASSGRGLSPANPRQFVSDQIRAPSDCGYSGDRDAEAAERIGGVVHAAGDQRPAHH